jgi:signal transduction histidine kinase
MRLRRKLRFQFSLLVFLILILSLLSIFFAFSQYREEEFYDRLFRKAKTAAVLLLEVEEVNTQLLKKIEDNSTTNLPNQNILIFNSKSKLIFNSKGNSWNITDSLLRLIRHDRVKKFKMDNFDAVGYYYKGDHDSIVVIILAEDVYGVVFLARLKAILLSVFFLSIVVIILSGKIYVDKTLDPINKLIQRIDAIGITNLSERLEEGNRTDEISKLARAFNLMLERLEAAFHSQKIFVSNASHELRTPLTVISGQLEVLLLKARTNHEYEAAITSTLHDILGLIRMSNRLLMLAHASSDFSEIKFTILRVDDAIWLARQELKKLYPAYNINVQFSENICEDKHFKISGNEMLMTSALSNLMENGCKYSKNHSVDVHLENQENNIVIRFTDQGIGVRNEEISYLFEPFFRGSNTTNIRGKGIGLSIVSKVIALHKGTVTIRSEFGKGSEFTVTIPLIIQETA